MAYADREIPDEMMPLQFSVDYGLITHKNDLVFLNGMLQGFDSSTDNSFRSKIATHCIQCYTHHERFRLLFSWHNHHFSAVVPAVGARPVRQFRLMAVRTFADTGWRDFLMCPAFISS